MPFILLPLTHVQVFVVVIAVTLPLSEILSPLAMILIVGSLLLVGAVKDSVAVPDNVPTLSEHLAIVVVPIAVGVLRVDSLHRPHIIVPAVLLSWVRGIGTE